MSLVGHWPLHEQSGRPNDLSGNNGDGATNGGITQGVAGKGGLTSYSFDGTDDSVALDHSFGSAISELSMFCWIKTSSNDQPVLSHDRSDYYRLGVGSAVTPTGVVSLSLTDSGGTTSDYAGNSRVDDGEWHHIGFTYNNGTFRIYVDGKLDKRGSHGSQIGTGTTRYGFIGDGSEATSFNGSTNSYYYSGNAADARIYDRVLTPKEIKTLYEQGARGSAKPDGISRYEFEGNATDSWGSNDGTNNGATFVDGKFGQAALFNGSDTQISISSLPTNIDPVAISLWYKKSSFTGNNEAFVYNGVTSDFNLNFYYTRIASDSVTRFATKKSGTWTSYDTPDLKADGVWHHRIVTFDSGTVNTYEDGDLIDTGSLGTSKLGNSDTQDAAIGASVSNGANFDGLIDDVRIYPRALNSEEVSAIYNSWSEIASPATDGVSYYPLDGDAIDQWGTNDGTVSGATVTGDAIRGRAYSFDGTDDYISLGNWEVPSNFTITSWVKPTALDNNDMIFDQWFNSSSTGNVLFRLESGTPILYIKDGGGNNHSVSGDNLTTDSWYFLTGSWDGSELRLTINGVVVDAKYPSITRNITSDDTYIGARQSNTAQYFNGNIDDVRVYNRGLSLHEIHQLYLWGTRGKDLRPNLVRK